MHEDIECNVCRNRKNNTSFLSTEMMLGLGDEFMYLNCSHCHSLSLLNIPKDMSKYYPSNYYSYNVLVPKNEKIKNLIRRASMRGKLRCGNYLDVLVNKIKKISYSWVKSEMMNLDSKILDVGCGNGFLLRDMQNFGFTNLTGIDLYGEKIIDEKDLKLYKKDIYSLKEKNYDLIMYHHSFEHILNPNSELKAIHDKLKDNGTLLINIPLCDSYAFRKYQDSWVQLDAPRHFYLYTVKSMQILAKNNNFIIEDIIYNSNKFQFTGSECYLRNLSIGDYNEIFTEKELDVLDKKSEELNLLHDGDSACFYLKKIGV